MLPTINGKQIIDCTVDDLQAILKNQDYRENEYLDYKSMFGVDQYSKGDDRQKKEIAEFRSDICSFANASGGYILLGVKEEKGVATELCGIELKEDNPDRFEMRLKNYLQPIEPRMPNCRFHFLHLENGRYIVIILVHHDAFAPYLHIENQKDYKAYKRIGNDKRIMTYMELKNMFVQAIALEDEIESARKKRIEFFMERGHKRFMLVQIVPDTFVDSSYNRNVYVLNRKDNNSLSGIFQPFSCYWRPFPSADGLYRKVFENDSYRHECRLFNNLAAEAFDSLHNEVNRISDTGNAEFFSWALTWEHVRDLVHNYVSAIGPYLQTKRFFVLVSIIGCLGVCTERRIDSTTLSTIDRDRLFVSPCVFEDLNNASAVENSIKILKLNYMLALGITGHAELMELLKELE